MISLGGEESESGTGRQELSITFPGRVLRLFSEEQNGSTKRCIFTHSNCTATGIFFENPKLVKQANLTHEELIKYRKMPLTEQQKTDLLATLDFLRKKIIAEPMLKQIENAKLSQEPLSTEDAFSFRFSGNNIISKSARLHRVEPEDEPLGDFEDRFQDRTTGLTLALDPSGRIFDIQFADDAKPINLAVTCALIAHLKSMSHPIEVNLKLVFDTAKRLMDNETFTQCFPTTGSLWKKKTVFNKDLFMARAEIIIGTAANISSKLTANTRLL